MTQFRVIASSCALVVQPRLRAHFDLRTFLSVSVSSFQVLYHLRNKSIPVTSARSIQEYLPLPRHPSTDGILWSCSLSMNGMKSTRSLIQVRFRPNQREKEQATFLVLLPWRSLTHRLPGLSKQSDAVGCIGCRTAWTNHDVFVVGVHTKNARSFTRP